MTAVLQPIAWLDHDWAGGCRLESYPPVAAAEKRGGEQLHDRLYGMETRSPLTPYLAVWRDTARHTAYDRKLGWPSQIGLWAIFGTDPWVPPPSLIDMATQSQQRDDGRLLLKWHWTEDHYRLHELGLELTRAGQAEHFRSFHRGDELAELDVTVGPIDPPASDQAAIAFQVSGHLRIRYNFGEILKGDAIGFTAMGTAPVQPGWMMY